jgi:periplasmic protein TonB
MAIPPGRASALSPQLLLYNSMNATFTRPPLPGFALPVISRNLAIVLSVVLLHLGFIWALYSGLLMRAVELVVPVVVMSQLIEPPAPKVAPPPPPPPAQQLKKAITKAPTVAAPLPVAINDPTPTPNAPTGSTAPQPAPAPIAAPVAAAPVAAPAPPAVQLPSSDADYLQNPRPPYPAISRRMNEQGKTTVRVLIGADGQPQRAEIAKSSGFARLDEAAIATVMRWRYAPGKRGGVAEAMWFNVPINWVLE